jgi:putative transposase
MLAGRRFRVEFTDAQEAFAEQIGAVCRAVWNTGLEQRRQYRRGGAWMNYRPQAKELAEAKAEHPWLAQVPGHWSIFSRALVSIQLPSTTLAVWRSRVQVPSAPGLRSAWTRRVISRERNCRAWV